MKKNKKDILILCQYFYPEKVSSATLPYDTAIYLANKGLSVSVLTGKSRQYNKEKRLLKNETLKNIEIKRVSYISIKSNNILLKMISFISFIISIYFNFSKLKNYKTIIVYSNPPFLPKVAINAKKKYGTKVIYVTYDLYPEIAIRTKKIKENGYLANKMKKTSNKIFKNVNFVIALSSEMKEFIISNRDIDRDKVIVIPNWFKNDYKEIFYLNDGNLNITYLGNMGIAQDMDTVINSMIKLRNEENINFEFIGQGFKKEIILKEVKKHDLNNVKVNDFMVGKALKNKMNNSDVFIVSLKQGMSGLAVPSKIYHYLMLGKPLICILDKEMDISKEITDYGAGFIINNEDSDSFSKAILKLKNDFKLRKQMSENARKLYLDKYKEDINLDKYYELIMKTLEETKYV